MRHYYGKPRRGIVAAIDLAGAHDVARLLRIERRLHRYNQAVAVRRLQHQQRKLEHDDAGDALLPWLDTGAGQAVVGRGGWYVQAAGVVEDRRKPPVDRVATPAEAQRLIHALGGQPSQDVAVERDGAPVGV